MKRNLNIIFFGICFLAAILAEFYCIQVLQEDLFSIVAIGIVALIMSYLLLDSIRSTIIKRGKDLRFYFDHMYHEETEKWTNRYTDSINLQKATYTALKKNTTVHSEQLEDILLRMNTLEENYKKDLLKITELQRKALEGQKNALNLEINYNKENTKLLLHALREEGSKIDQKELLQKILETLEKNNILLQEQIQHMKDMPDQSYFVPVHETKEVEGPKSLFIKNEMNTEDLYSVSEAAAALEETEEYYDEIIDENIEKNIDENIEENIEENIADNTEKSKEQQLDYEDEKPDLNFGEIIEERSEVFTEEKIEEGQEESTSNINLLTEEDGYEADSNSQENTVAPLYDDPNKTLSADEIAALFASLGQ